MARDRRHVQPLRRTARRGTDRRRHGSLSVAPRLLQPAHRAGAPASRAQPLDCYASSSATARSASRARPAARSAGKARAAGRRPESVRHRRRRRGRGQRGRHAAPRGLRGPHHDHRSRRRRALRSPQSLEGLSGGHRAGGLDAAPPARIRSRPGDHRACGRRATELGRSNARSSSTTAAPCATARCSWPPAPRRSALAVPERGPAARPLPPHAGRQPGHHRRGGKGTSGPSSLGASFIGLEVAASLRARGLEVHVVAPESRPLERVLGPELGDFVQTRPRGARRRFPPGAEGARDRPTAASCWRAASGCAADLVVAGIGVRPNLDAGRAGGARDRSGACRSTSTWKPAPPASSPPATSRAGRIRTPASGSGWSTGSWPSGRDRRRRAISWACGDRFDAVPFFWSMHYDVGLNYVGHAESWDKVEVDGLIGEKDCTVRYLSAGRALAAVTINRDLENLRLEVAMEHEAPRPSLIPPRRDCRAPARRERPRGSPRDGTRGSFPRFARRPGPVRPCLPFGSG